MADEQGLNPDFASRLNQLFQAVSQRGGNLGITSGFRTTAQQAALFAKSDKSGVKVAAPGHSNHEKGLAADLNGSLDLAHQLAPLFGLTFPMSYEPWHIEPTYARNPNAMTPPPVNSTNVPPTDPIDTATANFMAALSEAGATPGVFGTVSDAFNPTTSMATTTATSTAPTPTAATGKDGGGDFYTRLLNRLGYPVTAENLKFLQSWQRAEGGSPDNPFNTTQGAPGATNFNSVGVKRYPSVDVGLDATVKTLTNGRYGGILGALQSGQSAMAAAIALEHSPWGTGALVRQILGGR
jgi:hypothetical protein